MGDLYLLRTFQLQGTKSASTSLNDEELKKTLFICFGGTGGLNLGLPACKMMRKFN
jgi:hypothetical protein